MPEEAAAELLTGMACEGCDEVDVGEAAALGPFKLSLAVAGVECVISKSLCNRT